MKNLICLFCISLVLISCEKNENDTKDICTNNCTTLQGKFVTANNVPLANIKVNFNYRISGGELGGGYTRQIVSTRSNQNGDYVKDFYIKDEELGRLARGYFTLNIDDSKLNSKNYIKLENNQSMGYSIYEIGRRDTIIDVSFYIPKKTYIKVNLNNFIPQKEGDHFEVQTLFPFGPKVEKYGFLNTGYDTGFSGYDNFKATTLNNKLNVLVAESETNIVRVISVKNGIAVSVDYEINVPPNNTIELTYNY
jgi:hypothetical protein